MSISSRCDTSIRPSRTNNSVDVVGDGLGVEAGDRRRRVRARGGAKLCSAVDACPCCPVARDDADVDDNFIAPDVVEPPAIDELNAPEEQEPAEMPLVLPSVYQPTRSEYLDHCVTHYPFRAWCRHCLEGRGREFGHVQSRGDKDVRCTPVVSFDYCFIIIPTGYDPPEDYLCVRAPSSPPLLRPYELPHQSMPTYGVLDLVTCLEAFLASPSIDA